MDARADTNPFPGLRPFSQDEADLFFGRDRQCDDLVRRLASRRFLAVVGTSGSGKSSLVRAGLLPALQGGFMAAAGTHWRTAIMRPQDDPIGFLARAMVGAGALAHLDLAPPAAAGVVETTLRRSGLGLVEAARLARPEPHENLLVLVDQFEELFRFADLARERGAEDDAPAFVKLLLEAVRQTAVPVYVVITMRSDFLGDCARFRDLPQTISDSQYLIPRLTRDELQLVITGPIGVRGGRIAPSLVQHLLNDVGDDMDQLPVLQHALMRTWDHWKRDHPETRAIDLNDLTATGGMAEALSRHADEAFEALTGDHDRAIAERLLKCLTERGSDNREVRRPTALARLARIANADPADVIRVIDVFRAPGRSFLMPPHDGALDHDSIIDISHESLIRQWGRLRAWVEEEVESRTMYLRLVDAARRRRDGKAGLWREPDLTYARQWQERQLPNAAWAEQYGSGFDDARAFLSESEAAHAAELEEERQRAEAERMVKERELQQAKALAEAQRQRADEQVAARVRQRRFSLALCVLLAIAVGTALYGWRQQLAAARQSRMALSRQLAVQANESGRGLDLALLFGVAAHGAAPTREARQSLQQALSAQPQLRTFLSARHGGARSVAFSGDGRTIASSSGSVVLLWDTASRALRGEPLEGHQASVASVAFSPDGRMLASGSEDYSVILWDVASRKSLGPPLTGHKGWVNSVAFSPDGRTLVSGSEDQSVMVWDVASRTARWGGPDIDDVLKGLGHFKGHQGGVKSVAFSPDGRAFVSGSMDQTMLLWDAATGAVLGEPFSGRGVIWSVAFSPDGQTLASGAFQTVTLWNVASRKMLDEPLKGHQKFVHGVAFSPDGRTLASGGDDKTTILWDVASRKPRGQPLGGHQSQVHSVAFSPDGRTLASASDDQTVILWEVANRIALVEELKGHQDWVRRVAFSPDGRTLASASADQTVILWDVASRKALASPLTGHKGLVGSVAFSPDGKTLASAGDVVILWDVESRTPRGQPLKGEGAVNSIAFSPDGRMLASAGADATVILWDVASRTPLGDPIKVQYALNSVAFSPDGRRLAFANYDDSVVLFDVASRRAVGDPLKAGRRGVSSVAFSPDGRMLASAHQDSAVILWDLATRQPLGEPFKVTLSPDNVTFSPDGRTLAFTNGDGAVILVDMASRTPIGEPLRGGGGALAFSPDGRLLASAGKDYMVILWDVDIDLWSDKACTIANRNLTHREWAQYVGDDVPYLAPCPKLPIPKG